MFQFKQASLAMLLSGVAFAAQAATGEFVLRSQTDAAHDRLWVLKADALYAYEASSRKLIRRVPLPGWTYVGDLYGVCPPDLLVSASGSALVTSNIVPTLWEVDSNKLTVRKRSLALDADRDKDVGFTALAFDGERRQLLANSAMHGSFWRIDLAASRAYRIAASAPLRELFRSACQRTAAP